MGRAAGQLVWCLTDCRENSVGDVSYGRSEAHRKPSQVGSEPTSVGFATSARAECAFIVLQRNERFERLNLRWAPQIDGAYCRPRPAEYLTGLNIVNRYFAWFNSLNREE
jgi:hypothetical protein